MPLDPALAEESFCYLTTTGRVTGNPHEIEIWFGTEGSRIYMLSGGRERSDWVKNLKRDPAVSVRIGSTTFAGRARIVEEADEDERARQLLLSKYEPGYSGDLSNWGKNALPVAVELALPG